LKYHQPDSTIGFSMGMWHYARGYAFVAKNDIASAENEWKALSIIAADTAYKQAIIFGINNQYDVLNVAANMVKAEIEGRKGNVEAMKKYFTVAADVEDNMNYNEPPDWFFPVRNAYGAALMEAGLYSEAEKVLRENLEQYKDDPWALCGLYQCLEKQNKTEEAAKTKADFLRMWQYADFELAAPRIL
jgi:tetratricopeptide (TPR) repeat protein